MLNLKKKPKQASLRSLPSKRSINLATVGEKKIKASSAVPAIIVILLIAAVIGKFTVYDRIAKVSKAQGEVASLQQQIDNANAKIAEFGDLADEYAHFTYSGMTAEELNTADRVAILDLIKNDVMPTLSVSSWTINGNQLDMTVTGDTLQRINEIANNLQNEEDMVNYTTVMTATTDNRNTNRSGVTARIIVVLNGPVDEEAAKK